MPTVEQLRRQHRWIALTPQQQAAILSLIAAAPPLSAEEILDRKKYDQQLNPHNEPYHNTPRPRSTREIQADSAIEYAWTVLARLEEPDAHLDKRII
jgi:hypothetical protein